MPVQDRPSSLRGITPSHNLWNKALDTLGVETRNILDLTQVILRDVVEKIIVWVEKFIAVGDAAMQYDPVLAALAWGAFRFVLQVKATTLIHCAIFVDSRQMAVNGQRAFGETIENLEAVSHLITRYAILEELYLQRNSAASEKLEDIVVRIYAENLIFLAKAKKYFQSEM